MNNPVIRVDGIRKQFGGQEVLKGVSFEVQAGQTFAFLGRNDNGRDFRLTKLDESFDTTLTTNKIIARRVHVTLSRADRNRTLESDISDALHDLLKVAAISDSRI